MPGTMNSGGSETQVFCYDEQNRLTWAGNTGTPPSSCSGNGTPSNTLNGAGYHATYSYNNLGQIVTGPYNGTGTTQQYLSCDSNHPHALTIVAASGSTCSSQTGTVYTASYDAHGNMTSRATKSGSSLDTQTLSFDGQDRLVRWNDTVTTSNEEWYMYDASGNRVLQRSTTGSGASNTTITVYAFGLEDHVYNGSGTLTGSKYYYSLGGRLLGKANNSGAMTFYLTDALGSVLASFSGASGTTSVASNQTFGPYGNLQYTKGTVGTAKGFTGQYLDDLSGLYNFGARSYDQLVGTFLSADTVQGNLLGDDPYAYVGGNPETESDPSGQLMVTSCYSQGCGISAIPSGSDSGTTSDTALGGNYTNYTQTHPTDPSIDTTTACLKLTSCQVGVLANTGSVGATISSTGGCAAVGISFFGFSPCIRVPGPNITVRVDTAAPVRYCPHPTGCGDESGTEDQEETTGDKAGNLTFADTGEGGAHGQPQEGPTEQTQAAAGDQGSLYRVLRADEDPSKGITAKDPNATKSVFEHVRDGSKPGFQSQYISMTADLGVALEWATTDDLQIAQIDPALLQGNVIDLSTREALADQGITWQNSSTRVGYSFALGSQEVLAQGYIPPEAITWVGPASVLTGLL